MKTLTSIIIAALSVCLAVFTVIEMLMVPFYVFMLLSVWFVFTEPAAYCRYKKGCYELRANFKTVDRCKSLALLLERNIESISREQF